MLKSSHGTKLERAGEKWPSALYVSLFCIVVVFSGLYQLCIDLTGYSIPLQALARFGLLAAAVPVLILVKRDGLVLAPTSVRVAAGIMLLAAGASFARDFQSSDDPAGPIADFLFMYGIGALIALVAFVPLAAKFGKLFVLSATICILFGAYQLVTQKLHLPTGYLENVGILYENFVNDRIRLVSFFRSAPRFAEFLVVISLFLMTHLLRPQQKGFWRGRVTLAATYMVIVVLLYNTYSRAGYILFLTSTAILILVMYRHALGGRGFGIGPAYALMTVASIVGILAIAGKFPLDRAILDVTSYRSRQQNWSVLTDRLGAGSVWDFLLGFGDAARYARGDFRYYVTDNLSLTLLLYGGLIGLVAAASLTIVAVNYARRVRKSFGYANLEPWIAFVPCLWIEGLFLDNHNTLFLSLLAILGATASASRAKRYAGDPSGGELAFRQSGLPAVKKSKSTEHGAGRLTGRQAVGSRQNQRADSFRSSTQ